MTALGCKGNLCFPSYAGIGGGSPTEKRLVAAVGLDGRRMMAWMAATDEHARLSSSKVLVVVGVRERERAMRSETADVSWNVTSTPPAFAELECLPGIICTPICSS